MHFSTFISLLLSVTNAQLHVSAITAGLEHFDTTTDNSELTDAVPVSARSNNVQFGQVTRGNIQKWNSIKPALNTFAADPDVKLYYNDFGVGDPEKKTVVAISVVQSLKASGIKADGVGLQSHFIGGSTPELVVQIANLGSFTEPGVEVAYAELDVGMTISSTGEQQARNTVEGCVRVVVDDKYSSVTTTLHGTGSACSLDENLDRKPAQYRIVETITGTTGSTTNSASSDVECAAQFAAINSTTSSNTSKKAANPIKIHSTVPGPKPSSTLIVQTGVSGMLHYTASMVWASWFLGTFFTIILAEIV